MFLVYVIMVLELENLKAGATNCFRIRKHPDDLPQNRLLTLLSNSDCFNRPTSSPPFKTCSSKPESPASSNTALVLADTTLEPVKCVLE